MDKKQVDRRSDEKPAEQGAGKHDPTRPMPDRKAPGGPKEEKGFGKPEGQPIDKQIPKSGRFGGKDILDGDRSDREAGRPVQLEDDDEMETTHPGRADPEPGLDGRQQEGGQDRRPREGAPTQR